MTQPEALLRWIKERRDNARAIASVKIGADRAGWLEDVGYFEAVIAALEAHGAPPEARETVAYEHDMGNSNVLSYRNDREGSYGTRELVYKTEADLAAPQAAIGAAPEPLADERTRRLCQQYRIGAEHWGAVQSILDAAGVGAEPTRRFRNEATDPENWGDLRRAIRTREATPDLGPAIDCNNDALMRLLDLVGDYWDIAWAEGRANRHHDDEQGSGQACWARIKTAAVALADQAQAVASSPSITERELSFALNYHSDDTRINDADWKIARRYFEVIESNRGTHPSLGGAAPQAAIGAPGFEFDHLPAMKLLWECQRFLSDTGINAPFRSRLAAFLAEPGAAIGAAPEAPRAGELSRLADAVEAAGEYTNITAHNLACQRAAEVLRAQGVSGAPEPGKWIGSIPGEESDEEFARQIEEMDAGATPKSVTEAIKRELRFDTDPLPDHLEPDYDK